MTRSRILALLTVSLLVGAVASSMAPPDAERQPLLVHEEGRVKRAFALAAKLAEASRGIPPAAEGGARGADVLAYDLSWEVDPAVHALAGTTVARLVGTGNGTDTLTFQLDDAYGVTSVSVDGPPLESWSRPTGRVALSLSRTLQPEERATVTIAWAGVPPAGGALSFWTHDTGAAVTSVAEPFLAPTFWACFDDVADKAVTTFHVTVPAGVVAATSGVATTEPLADGRVRWTWRLPQPIPSYLVSLAASNYVTVLDRYTAADGREMPITGYLLPQHAASAGHWVAAHRGYLSTLSSLYGAYPFLDTKYGIVEASFGGGMENPTMTSISTSLLADSARDLTLILAHELSHHWWGDHVTMRTWDDLWLNEGFATYSEVLYAEKAQGAAPGARLFSFYDDHTYGGRLGQTVVAPVDEPFRYYYSVYFKGAWALHMLRRRVGDDVFFPALRAYGDAHAFGNATRHDLSATFEARSGLDLKQFFDQWVETPYRPTLKVTWHGAPDLKSVDVTVTQTQTHSVVHPVAATGDTAYYRFPLVVRLTFNDGTTADVKVSVEQRAQTFTIPTPSGRTVVLVAVDPDSDVLKLVESVGPG